MNNRKRKPINFALRKLKKFLILPKFLRKMKKLQIGGLSGGNSLRLIIDGDDCFKSFLSDIKKAKKSINLESYIFNSDHIGWMIAKSLTKKAKQGIEVNVIYDSFGSLGSASELFDYLRKNHVEVIEYNPILPWRKFAKLTFRDHRKILVIDGKIAYVGGINIGKEYAGKELNGDGWRDTHLRIEGPAVRDIQFFFIENWYRHGGSIVNNSLHFPNINEKGSTLLMVLSTRSRTKIRPISESYMSAIKNAKKNIYITNAYFVPDRRIYHALVRAAKRGVDVRLILPSNSDIQVVKHASRYLYHYYLRHGIRVYEYKKSILHAKTAVIDEVWSTVGSSNLDRISLYLNLELNVAVLDNKFGRLMEKVFKKDVLQSIEITREKLKRRTIFQFAIQWLCYRFRNIL